MNQHQAKRQIPKRWKNLGDQVLLLILGGFITLLVQYIWKEYFTPPPPLCELFVISNVADASISIGGTSINHKTVANSNVSIGKFEPGTYFVKVEKQGYWRFEIQINLLAEQKKYTLVANLFPSAKVSSKSKVTAIIMKDGRPQEITLK